MPWLYSIIGGLAFCVALAAVFLLVHTSPWVAVGVVVAAIFALPLGWLFVSALLPVVEDHNCPACGEWALEPMDPEDRYGARCTACGHEDPSIPGSRLGHEPPAGFLPAGGFFARGSGWCNGTPGCTMTA